MSDTIKREPLSELLKAVRHREIESKTNAEKAMKDGLTELFKFNTYERNMYEWFGDNLWKALNEAKIE